MSKRHPSAIVGAGLAGLIAGYAFPGVPILEGAPRAASPHRALLRFRTDSISRLTGIPFRKVLVRKGVWSRGAFVAPNIQLDNLYAVKCLGRPIGDRSIWGVEPVTRWVGPETLLEEMTEATAGRIAFDTPYDFAERGLRGDCREPLISTAPLHHALDALPGIFRPRLERAPIWVRRFRVEGADLHQTVYFPDLSMTTYRASMTGDLLIVELRSGLSVGLEEEVGEVCRAFGLDAADLAPLEAVEQRYGKIVPLPDDARRGLMAKLTIEAGIYSLGRFATWRNVLLDDVERDAEVIRQMLRASSSDFAAIRASAGPG